MKLDWRIPKPSDVSEALLKAASGNPLVARILVGRGMSEPEEARRFLDPLEYMPASPDRAPGPRLCCGTDREGDPGRGADPGVGGFRRGRADGDGSPGVGS